LPIVRGGARLRILGRLKSTMLRSGFASAARFARLTNSSPNAVGLRDDKPQRSNDNEENGESFENPFHDSLPSGTLAQKDFAGVNLH
jgi:hypothetical protein